jgi:glycosyltransferase involved in cell wall biosynthesis
MVLADRDFPPDIRVEKEVRALKTFGHNLVILSAGLGKRPSKEVWQGSTIVRVQKLQSPFRQTNSLIRLTLFSDLQWHQALLSVVDDYNIDLLHVHDLPMVGTALGVARRRHLPVIADLHENYPAALKYYFQLDRNWIGKVLQHLFFRQEVWQSYELRCAKQSNHILVVVEEAKERLMLEGISSRKITVIQNTEDIAHFEGIDLDETLIRQYEKDFVMLYIGGFGGRHRGLETIVEAMPQIINEIPNARLLLVGDGPIKPRLQQMVIESSLGNSVSIIDWQPFNRVPSFIAASKICLVPHQSNPHTEATSPHKLFQYMLMGKPVVVSTCKPLRRIIEETRGGLIFEAGSSESFANTVLRLRNDELRLQLGAAGKQAVWEKYNWERTSKRLISVYEQFGRN